MFKHYWKIAWRQFRNNILFSAINILGFVIGMTAACLIYLWVLDELTYEDMHPDADRIYRVVNVVWEGNRSEMNTRTVAPLSRYFRENFPQVEDATFYKMEDNRIYRYGEAYFEGDMAYVDTNFFDIFRFPVIEGNPALIKTQEYGVVISDRFAQKLFGKESAVGKEFYHDVMRTSIAYTVVAVVHLMPKTHFDFDVLANPYQNTMESYFLTRWKYPTSLVTYVKIRKDAGFTDRERMAMSRVWADRLHNKSRLLFQPLTDIHLHTDFPDTVKNQGNAMYIYIFTVLAFIVIFMGAFNFATLSTARASLRYKEIGVRKVCGAYRSTLMTQFLSESVILAVFSLLLALSFTELLLPLFNEITHKEITLGIDWKSLSFILLVILSVGCLSGIYPALFMSAQNPLLAFKGGRKNGKKGELIRSLVCVQFILAILLLFSTVMVYKQLYYIQHADLGVDRENIITVRSNLWYNVETFKQEVLANPKVLSVSMGMQIDNYWRRKGTGTNVTWIADGKTDSLYMRTIWVDGDFVKTYGLELIKGEVFSTDASGYWSGEYEFPVVLNETAWKAMGVKDPLGIQIKRDWGTGVVRGVVKDFHFEPLHRKIEPAFLIYSPESISSVSIKIAPDGMRETLQFIKEKYERFSPGKVFNYHFFEDMLERNYESERQQGIIFLVFTLIAIVIAVMGVFGLVVLAAQQRTKEIGIRKVNGAQTRGIVRLFCAEYLKWVMLALLIALPLGYVFAVSWLETFAYHTSCSWWVFAVVAVVILSVTLLTVMLQSYRAAIRNPIDSLRFE